MTRILLLAAIALATSCGRTTPAVGPITSKAPGAKPTGSIPTGSSWVPGEQLWFRISMFGVHVADMVAAVGELGTVDGRAALVVRGRASTAGPMKLVAEASEESIVWVDAGTGIPFAREDVIDDGPAGGVQRFAATYHDGHVAHQQKLDGGHVSPWKQRTPEGRPVYDNFSIVGLLRGWRATPGTVAEFYAVTDRLLHLHIATYVGIEQVTVLGRKERVHRYDVEVFETTFPFGAPLAGDVGTRRDDQSYSMWFTDDAGRVPVRIAAPHRAGRMLYELTDYQ